MAGVSPSRGLLSGATGSGEWRAAGPGGSASKESDTKDGQYADSLLAEPESPGFFRYALFTVIGAPRDIVALVLEPAGYGVGAIAGTVLYIVSLPLQMLYSGEYEGMRPVARGCVMAMSFPFFIVSDIFCRSFTGDMNRYRWGVHPFPRADFRWFPNYHAILDMNEE